MGRPDLIVPIRDRRKRRRILTLKNLGWVAIIFAAFFVGITIESNLRRRSTTDAYGRLFGKQVSSQTTITPKKYEAVTEAPVVDQTAADPLLVDAMRREQYLQVQTATTPPASDTVSGPNGITIITGRPQPSRPLLSGGIFRQSR